LFINYPPLLEYPPDEGMLLLPQGIELALSKYMWIDGHLGGGDLLGQLGGPIQPALGRPSLQGLSSIGGDNHTEVEIAVLMGIPPGVGAEQQDPAYRIDFANPIYNVPQFVFGNHMRTRSV
jgi:hypothetical protein